MRAPRAGSIEEKVEYLRSLEEHASEEAQELYQRRLDMSWIYHDNALEGVVYTPEELRTAIEEDVVSDTSLMPTYDEIRQHKEAIDLVRELAQKKRLTVNLDVIKQIYFTLDPEEAESKGTAIYRKEVPLHRLYFHEIAPPDKISYRMRQLVQWMGSNETKRLAHPVRVAAKAHYTLMQIYPFPKHSGKVARLLMNLLLMRDGYPPAILHATDRQRYYEALKNSADALARLVNEALRNSVVTGIRYFEQESATG